MELLKHLPNRLQVTEIGLFQKAVEPIHTALEAAVADFELQLDPTTATWGLANWEQTLGLTTDETRDEDYRRSAIVSALRGAGTTTIDKIKTVAESFSNGTVEVVEVYDEYRFEIHFTSTIGTPPNMDDLTATIESIKPAHLAYSYVIQFQLWGEVKPHTWGDLQPKTWDDVKEHNL